MAVVVHVAREGVQPGRAPRQQSNTIGINRRREPLCQIKLHASMWGMPVKVFMHTVKEDAKQCRTGQATLALPIENCTGYTGEDALGAGA